MGLCLEPRQFVTGLARVPEQPDRRWVDDWLHRSYAAFWAWEEQP